MKYKYSPYMTNNAGAWLISIELPETPDLTKGPGSGAKMESELIQAGSTSH